MTKIKPISLKLVIALAALALAGCMTMPTPMLPAGGRSSLNADNYRIRAELVIAPVSLPRPLTYRPVASCSYQVITGGSSGNRVERRQDTSIRRVRDRLLVTTTGGGNVSTALIGDNGQVFDFNATGSDGARSTRDTFLRTSEGKSGDPTINPINLALPNYHRPAFNVGEHVAFVQHHSGWPWGYYVYRGTTTYRGQQAIVLDLTTPTETDSRGEWLTVGFSVIDVRTSMPLIYVLDAGFDIHVEQIACR